MLEKLFNWYGKKAVITTIVVMIGLLIVGFSGGNDATTEVSEENLTKVRVSTAAKLDNPDTLSMIGTIRSINEVEIIPERSGKVTRVGTSLGATVEAGQVIVELENAAERASLLQAEGAYEAAEAAAAVSGVGADEAGIRLQEAKNTLESASNSAYGTVTNVINNTFDIYFYANPNSTHPTLRINALGDSDALRQERIELQTVLANWNEFNFSNKNVSALYDHANFVSEQLSTIIWMTDSFITAINDSRNNDRFSDTERSQINTQLTSTRSQLVTAQNSIEAARFGLETAEEGVEKAEIASTGGQASAADAQIKQALGSLRAAQANYAKTILRTPIRGTVNSLNVKLGELLSPSTPIATIANNGQLEIVTYISEQERDLLMVGDEVELNEDQLGTVAAISPAIDPGTGKIEVRIFTDSPELLNGETVNITKSSLESVRPTVVRIPLTAIKFSGTEGAILIVQNDTLVSVPVILGDIRGDTTIIESGLDLDTAFVIDARGRNAGEKVEVVQN